MRFYHPFGTRMPVGTIFVVLFLIFPAACGEHDPEDKVAKGVPSTPKVAKRSQIPTNERVPDPGDVQIRHPLRGVKLIDGKVLAIDIKDSPISGKRFAYGERTFQLEENGAVNTESGIIEIEHHAIAESYQKNLVSPPPPQRNGNCRQSRVDPKYAQRFKRKLIPSPLMNSSKFEFV